MYYYEISSEREQLYNETGSLVSQYNNKREQLQALEQKLNISDDHVRQQVLSEGRSMAIKRKVDSLQADLEIHYLSIKKKQLLIQNTASKCSKQTTC